MSDVSVYGIDVIGTAPNGGLCRDGLCASELSPMILCSRPCPPTRSSAGEFGRSL